MIQKESLDILRHSCAHLMAQSYQRTLSWSKIRWTCCKRRFYYDFKVESKISDDLPKIEKKMKRISR